MGGRYPPMSPALPSYMRPTRAASILRPGVVLITLVVLLVCGIMGIGIGIARFKEERIAPLPASVSACQGFMITASGCSIVYVLVHAIASIHNEPIGDVRPPEKRLHAACFILAKLGLVLWIVGIITSAVVIGRPDTCSRASQECRLQMVDLVAANLSFVAMGIIMTALEACRYPFEVPEAFATGVSCRVSSFGDDLLERSASVASSIESRDEKKITGVEKGTRENKSETSDRPSSPDRPMPGGYPVERRLTPLLPMIPVSKASAWSDEVKQLVTEDALERRSSRKADSAISLSLASETSSESGRSTSDRGSRASGTKRLPPRPRVVTPSSSISNESRRSPLSRMRSAEFPDIIIQQELKFLPVSIPPPEKWTTTSRPVPSSRPPPPVVTHTTTRPPIAIPPKSAARKPGQQHRPIVRKPAPTPITRRNTLDIKVPGAFVDYRPSLDDERKLEEHARKIEAEIESRTQREQENGRPMASNNANPMTQYGEQRPPLRRSASTAAAAQKTKEIEIVSNVDHDGTSRVMPLRRLTLADVSPKLEGIFGEPTPGSA